MQGYTGIATCLKIKTARSTAHLNRQPDSSLEAAADAPATWLQVLVCVPVQSYA